MPSLELPWMKSPAPSSPPLLSTTIRSSSVARCFPFQHIFAAFKAFLQASQTAAALGFPFVVELSKEWVVVTTLKRYYSQLQKMSFSLLRGCHTNPPARGAEHSSICYEFLSSIISCKSRLDCNSPLCSGCPLGPRYLYDFIDAQPLVLISIAASCCWIFSTVSPVADPRSIKKKMSYPDLLTDVLAYTLYYISPVQVDAVDIALLARQISLGLVGVIIVTSLRVMLRGITRGLQIMNRMLGALLMTLLLTQLMVKILTPNVSTQAFLICSLILRRKK
ncbi:hypothetical protein L208DRAFT_1380931 [Tricholoma matsutake]|nr:hypothetical protein L208DRAFT_1380931 [Tricholoma matsutake 945]